MSAELAEQANPWWRDPAARPVGMPPRRRAQQRGVLEHLIGEPRRAALLRGPRQVGKTAILKQCVADLLDAGWPPSNVTYFDFSDERFPALGESPRSVAEHRAVGFDPDRPHVLLLDEITRADRWAEWLKQAVDAGGHRVVATDSAASVLRDGGESGVGRWDVMEIEALTYREFLDVQLRPDEDLASVERRVPAAFARYLAIGGFPEHAASDSVLTVWERLRDDIANKAIRKDLATAKVDTERMIVLFRYVLECSGRELDVQRATSEIGVDRRTLDKWADLLTGSMLVSRLGRHRKHGAAALRERVHPKLYASDHGLVMAFAAVPEPERDEAVGGRALETMVFRHLRELARGQRMMIGFHRPGRGEEEIDFVIELAGGRTVTVEVKRSRQPGHTREYRDTSRRRVGAHRSVLVYGGTSIETRDDVELVPAREFALDPGRWVS